MRVEIKEIKRSWWDQKKYRDIDKIIDVGDKVVNLKRK